MSVIDLAAVMTELVEILQMQAKELEQLAVSIEQGSRHLPQKAQLAVIHCSLSGLHLRLAKLRDEAEVQPP